jgi:Na+/H+ antiporter NhaD/arsenite permease-like protein
VEVSYIAVAAVAVFVVTLVLMIKRPRGLRLGYAAGVGAVASLLLGTVSLGKLRSLSLTFGTPLWHLLAL